MSDSTALPVPETEPRPHKRPQGAQPGNSNRRTHGVATLKRAVLVLGTRAIDRRTRIGKAVAHWRDGVIADLGGPEQLSTAELALLDEAVVTKLIASSLNAWILEQPRW